MGEKLRGQHGQLRFGEVGNSRGEHACLPDVRDAGISRLERVLQVPLLLDEVPAKYCLLFVTRGYAWLLIGMFRVVHLNRCKGVVDKLGSSSKASRAIGLRQNWAQN